MVLWSVVECSVRLHGTDGACLVELDRVAFKRLGDRLLQLFGFLHDHHFEARCFLVSRQTDIDTHNSRDSQEFLIVGAQYSVDVALGHRWARRQRRPGTSVASAQQRERGENGRQRQRHRSMQKKACSDFHCRLLPNHRGAEECEHLIDRIGNSAGAAAGEQQPHGAWIGRDVLDHERAGVAAAQEAAAAV